MCPFSNCSWPPKHLWTDVECRSLIPGTSTTSISSGRSLFGLSLSGCQFSRSGGEELSRLPDPPSSYGKVHPQKAYQSGLTSQDSLLTIHHSHHRHTYAHIYSHIFSHTKVLCPVPLTYTHIHSRPTHQDTYFYSIDTFSYQCTSRALHQLLYIDPTVLHGQHTPTHAYNHSHFSHFSHLSHLSHPSHFSHFSHSSHPPTRTSAQPYNLIEHPKETTPHDRLLLPACPPPIHNH